MLKQGALARNIVALIAIMFLFSGCQDTAKKTQNPGQKTVVLGFAQLGNESGWRSGNTRSIQRAASEGGIQLMFSNAEQKQENQIKAIRSFIAYRVDVIAFGPIVETGWDNVLAEAKQAGIPVLLIDRYIKSDNKGLYTCYIGSNFLEEGDRAAKFLEKKFAKENKQVNIIELMGTIDSSPAAGRREGFHKGIEGDSKFKIIASLSGDFMRSKGKEVMRNALKKFKI